MKTEYKNLSQRQLGKIFGVSSHVIGRWLKAIGLRNPNGKPSYKAFQEEFVDQAPNGKGGYYYVWNAERTIAALEEAGHQRIDLTESDQG